MDQYSDKLGELLADPKKLSAVMKAVSSVMGQTQPAAESSDKSSHNETPSPEVLPAAVPRIGKNNDRTALLNALKPFLSENRREKAGKIMTLISLADMAGGFKGFI